MITLSEGAAAWELGKMTWALPIRSSITNAGRVLSASSEVKGRALPYLTANRATWSLLPRGSYRRISGCLCLRTLLRRLLTTRTADVIRRLVCRSRGSGIFRIVKVFSVFIRCSPSLRDSLILSPKVRRGGTLSGFLASGSRLLGFRGGQGRGKVLVGGKGLSTLAVPGGFPRSPVLSKELEGVNPHGSATDYRKPPGDFPGPSSVGFPRHPGFPGPGNFGGTHQFSKKNQ